MAGETGRLRREVLAKLSRARSGRCCCIAWRSARSARPPAAALAWWRLAGLCAGRVALVGAGPGDPDLLTVRAARLLATADVVLHDDLVLDAVLRLARADAVRQNVGKRCGVKKITQEEINALMIAHARDGRSVVRLKSGDPLVFGRAAEEMDALREAGVEFEVVSGITAAFAAAAALKISLTDRRAASSVQFSSAHHAAYGPRNSWDETAEPTRVVYMPGRDFSALAAEWREQGLAGDMPCVAISRAAQPDQQIARTTIDGLEEVDPGPAPVLVLAGWALLSQSVAFRSDDSAGVEPAVMDSVSR